MSRSRQLFLCLALAGLMTGGGAVTAIDVANAASLTVGSPNVAVTPFEKADWVPRCWWRPSAWGPQQICKQVWVEPQYQGFDGGYAFRGGGEYRRHYHDHHEHYEDDEH
jgi:hypothetical protein